MFYGVYMRKNNTTTNVPRGTINKGTNKMINLNLTKEEKQIVITQLNNIIGFPIRYHKYLKPIKKPNEFTKKMIVQATEAWERNQHSRSVLNKVVEALTKDEA